MRRIIKGIRLGWYPFFAIIIRNIIAMIASLKIKNLKPEEEKYIIEHTFISEFS